jgi:predicted O-methyltransferase YrrM
VTVKSVRDHGLKTRLRDFIKKTPLVGKAYVQRDELRAVVNQLWEPPGHFYSPIPSLDEIRHRADRVFAAGPAALGGIDLDEPAQLATLEQLTRYYAEQPFTDHKREGLRYFFENPAFSYFDAIVFYCMIRHVRPRRVIEIGSGYSSCVLLDTNERFAGNSISCTFIEPYPRLLESLITDDDRRRVTIVASNLQDVDPAVFSELVAGDMLFVDSSHVSKTDSDVNCVFFDVLPRLNSGVHVHFHDIFYPFEYPSAWVYQGRAWNEAYTLRAFLQYNERFTIEVFNSFLETFHRDTIAREMPLCTRYSTQSMVPTSAQSIWLKKL